MEIAELARERLKAACEEAGVDGKALVRVRPLSPHEAIGSAGSEFVIQKGRERVVEAEVEGRRGQAFTDTPVFWEGEVEELWELNLRHTPHRAVFTASLNALAGKLGLTECVLHCKDGSPRECGPVAAEWLMERHPDTNVGLIGLQPAMLKALVAAYGAERVRVLDLNADNIGHEREGVLVGDGERDLDALAEWCGVGLATGSTVVNGSIDGIRGRFEAAGKPLVFYGNTIGGTAALLGLPHICPFGREG